ncbi:MAG: hypothetical protein U0T73_08630 [Chitinophagales bacterium]
MKKWNIILQLLFWSIAFSGSATASTRDEYVASITGANFQIYPGSGSAGVSGVYDPIHWGGNYGATVVQDNLLRTQVEFSIDNGAGIPLNNPFSCKVSLLVYYVSTGSGITSESYDLELNYDPNTQNTSAFKTIKVKDGSFAVFTSITNIIFNGPAYSQRPDVFRIDSRVIVDRDYVFNCNGSPGSISISQNPSIHENEVTIAPVAGADEYDVEWVFFDAQSYTATQIFSGINYGDFFRNNATRVTLKSTDLLTYKQPFFYPNGIALYRYRAAHYTPDHIREVTKWQPADNTLPSLYSPLALGGTNVPDMNWQYELHLSEGGKTLPSVKYYDGSQRVRQEVSRSSSDEMTVVGQTIYDHEGRPAMKVMPSPTYIKPLSYYSGFSLNGSGQPYSAQDFDVDPCEIDPPAMQQNNPNNYGSAWYYSDFNTHKNTKPDAFIPDADGYPYTITEFTPDATGRVKRQGGAGEELRFGGQHVTQNYYGKPTQEELDLMFGNEVGYAEHYSKNAVKDANGQVSVTYQDAHGRTIATALAGTPPSNLEALSNYPAAATPVTSDILNDPQLADGNSLTSSYDFIVTSAGDRTFDYKLEPKSFTPPCPANSDLCFECLYDVTITVTDDCGNTFNSGQPFVQTFHNYTITDLLPDGYDYDSSCARPDHGIDPPGFTLNLPVGHYNITKKLSVPRQVADEYAQIWLRNNTCAKTFQSFLDEATAQLDFGMCNLTCAQCSTRVNNPNYKTDLATRIFTAGGVTQAEANEQAELMYQKAKERCDMLCGTTSGCMGMYEMMLGDVSPGGQYCKYATNTTTHENIADPNDVHPHASDASGNPILLPNILANIGTNYPPLKKYSDVPAAEYQDDQGHQDFVYSDQLQQMVSPNQLSVDEFVKKFRSSWAKALVKYHPEYPYYEYCLSQSASDAFDREFMQTESYADALAHGYLNPLNVTPITSPNVVNVGAGGNPGAAPIDPLFAASTSTLGLMKARGNMLNNDVFRDDNYDLVSVSIWDMAYMLAMGNKIAQEPHPTGATYNNHFGEPSCTADLDQQWKVFRSLYMQLKQRYYNQFRAVALVNANHELNTTIGDGVSGQYGNINYPSVVICGSTFTNWLAPQYMDATGYNHVIRASATGIPDVYNTVSSGSCSITKLLYNVYFNRQPRVPNEAQISQLSNVPGVNTTNPPITTASQGQAAASAANTTMQQQNESACEGYASRWIELIKREDRCGLFSTGDETQLKKVFVAICKSGVNANPSKMSTTTPNNTGVLVDGVMYYSFQDAIEKILHVTSTDVRCNAYWITYPSPYGVPDRPLSDQVMAFHNDCVCDRLQYFKQKHQLSGSSQTFAQWLNVNYHTTLTEQDAGILDQLCTTQTACFNVDHPITVPDVLSCDRCHNCEEVTRKLIDFYAIFPSPPGGALGDDMTNSDYRLLMEAYLNQQLGMNMTFDEYRTFLNGCSNSSDVTDILTNGVTVNSQPGCTPTATCTAIKAAVEAIKLTQPSIHSEALAALLNQQLNWNVTYNDYLAIMRGCYSQSDLNALFGFVIIDGPSCTALNFVLDWANRCTPENGGGDHSDLTGLLNYMFGLQWSYNDYIAYQLNCNAPASQRLASNKKSKEATASVNLLQKTDLQPQFKKYDGAFLKVRDQATVKNLVRTNKSGKPLGIESGCNVTQTCGQIWSFVQNFNATTPPGSPNYFTLVAAALNAEFGNNFNACCYFDFMVSCDGMNHALELFGSVPDCSAATNCGSITQSAIQIRDYLVTLQLNPGDSSYEHEVETALNQHFGYNYNFCCYYNYLEANLNHGQLLEIMGEHNCPDSAGCGPITKTAEELISMIMQSSISLNDPSFSDKVRDFLNQQLGYNYTFCCYYNYVEQSMGHAFAVSHLGEHPECTPSNCGPISVTPEEILVYIKQKGTDIHSPTFETDLTNALNQNYQYNYDFCCYYNYLLTHYAANDIAEWLGLHPECSATDCGEIKENVKDLLRFIKQLQLDQNAPDFTTQVSQALNSQYSYSYDFCCYYRYFLTAYSASQLERLLGLHPECSDQTCGEIMQDPAEIVELIKSFKLDAQDPGFTNQVTVLLNQNYGYNYDFCCYYRYLLTKFSAEDLQQLLGLHPECQSGEPCGPIQQSPSELIKIIKKINLDPHDPNFTSALTAELNQHLSYNYDFCCYYKYLLTQYSVQDLIDIVGDHPECNNACGEIKVSKEDFITAIKNSHIDKNDPNFTTLIAAYLNQQFGYTYDFCCYFRHLVDIAGYNDAVFFFGEHIECLDAQDCGVIDVPYQDVEALITQFNQNNSVLEPNYTQLLAYYLNQNLGYHYSFCCYFNFISDNDNQHLEQLMGSHPECQMSNCTLCVDLHAAYNSFVQQYGEPTQLGADALLIFTTYTNNYFNTNLSFYQWSGLFHMCFGDAFPDLNPAPCGNPVNDYNSVVIYPPAVANNGDNQLCTRPMFYIPPSTYDCVDNLEQLAYNNAHFAYQSYRDSIVNDLIGKMSGYCLQTLEELKMNFELKEYQYTLYYYDQAGNLVKTVPPAGVHLLNATQMAAVKAARNSNSSAITVPAVDYETRYAYNTLEKPVYQHTPDGGKSEFWYDQLGRIVVSQNAKQAAATSTQYSFTTYDALGRIHRAGQLENTGFSAAVAINPILYDGWLNGASNFKDVMETQYDIPVPGQTFAQTNLRGRVAAAMHIPTLANFSSTPAPDALSHYSYDIAGNVQLLVQQQPFEGTTLRNKTINYDYDLLSGKVNEVVYQQDQEDQFIHQYLYDANNRIRKVLTSTDRIHWEEEAKYIYYKHGPLARTEIGRNQVQGVDYAYTLQGWLKGVNNSMLDKQLDMGKDGVQPSASQPPLFAEDAYGFSLGYFSGDYKSISGNAVEPALSGSGLESSASLFNGNIRYQQQAITGIENGATQGFGYAYDQLNRIKKAKNYNNLDVPSKAWQAGGPISAYNEEFSYDENGNIMHLKRAGMPSQTDMDDMGYHYKTIGSQKTNQLDYVDDAVASANYPTTGATVIHDIDNQNPVNYEYDEIGNLKKDHAEGLTISWNVQGKISEIVKGSLPLVTHIRYYYDAMGNRIRKEVIPPVFADKVITNYVRDATGNIMATYETKTLPSGLGSGAGGGGSTFSPMTHLQDWDIYGNSRLGTLSGNIGISYNPPTAPDVLTYLEGKRQYELTNHLSNVLATINDRKTGIDANSDGLCERYTPTLVSGQMYYAFGSLMPGRTVTSGKYRFGFNGQLKDDDVTGTGNISDFKFRVCDLRLGRFYSIDPLSKSYPWNSSYAFAENRVIDGIDLEGKEWQPVNAQGQNVSPSSNEIVSYTWVGYEKQTICVENYVTVDGKVSNEMVTLVAPIGTVDEAVLPTTQNIDGVQRNGAMCYSVNNDLTPKSEFSPLTSTIADYNGSMSTTVQGLGNRNTASGTLSLTEHYENGKSKKMGEWNALSGPWQNGAIYNGGASIGKVVSPTGLPGMTVGNQDYGFPITPDCIDQRGGFYIHPDGNVCGTAGCIGIEGGAAQASSFREKMSAAQGKQSTPVRLNVDIQNNPNVTTQQNTTHTGE